MLCGGIHTPMSGMKFTIAIEPSTADCAAGVDLEHPVEVSELA